MPSGFPKKEKNSHRARGYHRATGIGMSWNDNVNNPDLASLKLIPFWFIPKTRKRSFPEHQQDNSQMQLAARKRKLVVKPTAKMDPNVEDWLAHGQSYAQVLAARLMLAFRVKGPNTSHARSSQRAIKPYVVIVWLWLKKPLPK